MFDVRCSVFDVRCSVFDVRSLTSKIPLKRSIFIARPEVYRSPLSAPYSLLTAQCSLLSAHYSVLTALCSPLFISQCFDGIRQRCPDCLKTHRKEGDEECKCT